MEKNPVPFVAISQALCNNDGKFVEEVYRLLAQHILLGKIAAENISFLTEKEYDQKFGSTCAQPIFAKKKLLFAALTANVRTIPLLSAYQNFFKFAKSQKGFDGIDLVINAYSLYHEKIFCSMCQQFLALLPPQNMEVEEKILNRSIFHSWLMALVIRRLKYLDISQSYPDWYIGPGNRELEIAEYLFSFMHATRSQAMTALEQIKFFGGDERAPGHDRLIRKLFQILQTQKDDLHNFAPVHEICRKGLAISKDVFPVICSMLKQENIVDMDTRKNFLIFLKHHTDEENSYDVLEVYNSLSVVNDVENIDIVVQNICDIIYKTADNRLTCKKALPIVNLALSTLHHLLCRDNIILHISSVKQIVRIMSGLEHNKLYKVSNFVAMACSNSNGYDTELLRAVIRQWPGLIKKIHMQPQQMSQAVSCLTELKEDASQTVAETSEVLEDLINTLPENLLNCRDIAEQLVETPFETLENIPKNLKEAILARREELGWQQTFLETFVP